MINRISMGQLTATLSTFTEALPPVVLPIVDSQLFKDINVPQSHDHVTYSIADNDFFKARRRPARVIDESRPIAKFLRRNRAEIVVRFSVGRKNKAIYRVIVVVERLDEPYVFGEQITASMSLKGPYTPTFMAEVSNFHKRIAHFWARDWVAMTHFFVAA